MGDIVGHWASLTEAQKLTQSMLLQGVVETVIEQGALLPRLPVKQIKGKDLLYNREKSWTASAGAKFVDIRERLEWTSDEDYNQITVALKRIARQDPLDNFVAATYSSINDYRAVLLNNVAKKVGRFAEHMLRYGDLTFGGALQFDGIHALAQEVGGENDVDEGEGALSLANLRQGLRVCKIDNAMVGKSSAFWLMPSVIADRISAGYEEAGLVRSSVTHWAHFSRENMAGAGGMVETFGGIPIIRDDFLVAEQANTGRGSDARALHTSGTKMYSVFLIRTGAVEDGGLELLFGNPLGGASIGEAFFRTPFEKLENYDGGGERIVSYLALALGAPHSLFRIHDITDAEVTP